MLRSNVRLIYLGAREPHWSRKLADDSGGGDASTSGANCRNNDDDASKAVRPCPCRTVGLVGKYEPREHLPEALRLDQVRAQAQCWAVVASPALVRTYADEGARCRLGSTYVAVGVEAGYGWITRR